MCIMVIFCGVVVIGTTAADRIGCGRVQHARHCPLVRV